MMVLALFFCSGATALVYEVVWSKYLSQMLGSTVQAQTVVLAVFMGGLALGNRIFGNRADKSERPLEIYGYIEGAIGIYAFFFEWIYRAADAVFINVGASILGQDFLLLSLKTGLSVGLLLGPTILMGGTLPLLAAWLQRDSADAGRRSARFYSINSLGAVTGSGFAGFVLIQNLGMQMTLQVTALANIAIAIAAITIARQGGGHSAVKTPAPGASKPVAAAPVDQRTVRYATFIVALTGGVSMGMEVLASRSLTLIFGASLQAFAVVLMAFILGIGLGSAVVASPRFRWLQRESSTIVFMLAAAGMIGFFVWSIADWVNIYLVAKSGLGSNLIGYMYYQFLITGISLVVLGVPAGLLGAVVPFWIRTLSDPSASLASQIGRLLTWNTVGAVVGVLFAGFVLMPTVGLRGAFSVLACLLCTAALLTAWWRKNTVLLGASIVMLAAILAVTQFSGDGWRHVLSSGVFRQRVVNVDPKWVESRKKQVRMLYYKDAADATVSVEEAITDGGVTNIALRINGKVDASNEGDLATQYLLGHLPLLARPNAKDVFVLGFGSGITGGAVLSHPIESLTIAENCRPVLEAGEFFKTWNRNVLHNERTTILTEDARTVLKLSPKKYDVIISEPSNPWMVGVGSVFSREFYEIAANRLKDGGVMTQWFHVYEMHDGIVDMVLKTFSQVFPYVEIWDPGVGDVIMLGSKQPWPSSMDAYRTAFERKAVREDMEAIGVSQIEWLWARQLASQRTAFAIPDGTATQSDAFPVLEYEAPRAFYVGKNSSLLNRFDERTWLHDLASPEKKNVMASMDNATLQTMFHRHTAANEDVHTYLQLRKTAADGRNIPPVMTGVSPVPILFRPTNAEVVSISVPDNASPTLKGLLRAEVFLLSNPGEWVKAIDRIEKLLKEAPPESPQAAVKWSRAHFLAVAARACYGHGDVSRAKDFILMAGPDGLNAELRHLARVMQRDQTPKGVGNE